MTSTSRSKVDWRGWIALAWVLVWGCAYVVMMLQARAPRIVDAIARVARAAIR